MASAKRLRILCLHGYKQHDVQFKNRTNALRKALKNTVEFHYISAPHKIRFDVHLKEQQKATQTQGDQESKQMVDHDSEYLPRARSWWNTQQSGAEYEYEGLEETLKYMASVMQNGTAFDGILGFSQGGVLATILCLLRKHPTYFEKTFNLSSDVMKQLTSNQFKFAWIVAGFMPRCNKLVPLLHDIASEKKQNAKIDDIPLLLVIGKTDQYVSTERAMEIGSVFKKDVVTVVEHEGGHYIPAHKPLKEKYVAFLSKM